MSALITIPDPGHSDSLWQSLSPDLRNQVRAWKTAFETTPVTTPINDYFASLAHLVGSSPGTVKRYYYRIKAGEDWSVFIPQTKLPRINTECRTNNAEFRSHLLSLVEQSQRSTAAAFRRLRGQWRQRQTIPGYDEFPGWPAVPKGWGAKNLQRIVAEETDKRRLRSIRLGVSSKTNPLLPQVFTTRTGLYPGAVFQLDDMWHENFVNVGMQRARVIEIAALDLFSAARVHWGLKPRLSEGGKFHNLRGADVRLYLAAFFSTVGYAPRGTMIMAEHGTAAIDEDIERILYDASRGLIRITRQGIEGKQQALTGFWGGTEGGNFRAKAALESVGNLIHNDLAHLPLQAGKDKDHRPVTTNRQLAFLDRIIRDVTKKNPSNLDRLRKVASNLTLDFFTDFTQLINDYYRFGLNARTDHELEGWEELGFLVTEYTTAPGSNQWLSQDALLSLPTASQQIISAAAAAQPREWSRRRRLSPAEVFDPARSSLVKLPDYIIADILTQDLARVEPVKGSYFRFSDKTIAASEVIYRANVLTPEGMYRELKSGEKFNVFSLPDAPRWLFVYDAKMRYIGKSELVKRVNPINHDAFNHFTPFDERVPIQSDELLAAASEKHQRTAHLHEDMPVRHADRVQDAQLTRDTVAHLIAGDPVTSEEKAAQRSRRAKDTRAANIGKVIAAGRMSNPVSHDSDSDTEDWSDGLSSTFPNTQSDIESW